MPLPDQSYLAVVHEADLVEAFKEWVWLVGSEMKPLFLSLSGDLFIRDDSGATFWIQTGCGSYERLADSVAEFETEWANDANRANWLLKVVVDDLIGAGHVPEAGQCFGYRILPVLGGDYHGENRALISAVEHVSFTGDLNSQIADLPDGASVEIEVVD